MKEQPTIKARRIGIVELPPERYYVYNGTERMPEPVKPKPAPVVQVCVADGCEAPQHAKGFCSTHRRKIQRGVPLDADNRRRGFDPAHCGTTKGYSRHLHYSVPLCDPCREAKNKYDRNRRAGKKAAA